MPAWFWTFEMGLMLGLASPFVLAIGVGVAMAISIRRGWRRATLDTRATYERRVQAMKCDLAPPNWQCRGVKGHGGACPADPLCHSCGKAISYEEHDHYHHHCERCEEAALRRGDC